MRNIIDNLHRQHKELTRLTMTLVPLLEPEALARDASEVRRLLQSLTGVLRVHISMEDRSFYPSLLQHRDERLRAMACAFLDERDQIQTLYFDFLARWMERAHIEREPAHFVADAREVLLTLGQRMMQEDRQFHPLIVERWETL